MEILSGKQSLTIAGQMAYSRAIMPILQGKEKIEGIGYAAA